MKRTKKWLFTLLAAITVLVLTACGAAGGNDEATVKVGVVGDQQEAWEHVKDVVKDEGINLEIVKFTDYVSPNQGLTDGSLDLNAYQTVEYLDNWNEEYGDDLVSIGYTHVEPMGLYSDKIKSIDDVEDGATVTLPNDKTNEARGLKVLEKAGLIKLNPDVDFPTAADDVVENPKNLKFEPIEAQQVPETKSDPKVQLAAINNNYAIEAGLSITDAIYVEPNEGTEPFWNLIATRAEDKDNENYKKVVEAFQTKETADIIKKASKDNQVPVFDY
ncbi:MAG: MetQ/NlpA family ABC transporter substrate-binding protein [Aerococcus sp.]|nr:MetQ/NlpA family ABC transporter substrate-binding protein [Aerococcus sp.]